MSVFQFLMLLASAFFAFKIYEHIQTLDDNRGNANQSDEAGESTQTFLASDLVEQADKAYEQDDKETALKLLNEANMKEPSNSDTLFKIGYILQQKNELDEALKYYKDCLYLDKDNEFVHNSMATIYKEQGEYASAKMHLNASLDIDSENYATYFNYGNLYVEMGHKDEAKTMYEKALELNPDFEAAAKELENLKGA